jgi:hypothetical protein
MEKTMQRVKRLTTRWFLGAIVIVIAFSSVIIFSPFGKAANLQDFKAGRIIDDGIFTNSGSMTAAQIQNFLSAKGSNCNDGQAPCLKHYYEGGRVAAQIIFDTAQEFQINPQVFIVLLQKEVGLITATSPANWQYRTATGYGCPDTAACDSQYYGFTNQLRNAGKMYRAIMNNSPTWYTPYFVGDNKVYYHPDLGRCGSSTVRIENRATVALYSYTPYQPNSASLNAGYGTGDSCSAYGNRNFFSYFTDWFGSTLLRSTLLRSVENGTIYLVTNDKKYPIPDINTFNALYPLGGVSFVAQSYLDSKTTGPSLGRVMTAADGSVYFFDAGIKLAFGTCAQVADYGYSCGNLPVLTDYQVTALYNGPMMTSVYKTTSGKRFYVTGNTKREVYDDTSLIQNSIASTANVLNETGINSVPYGTPLVRNNTFMNSRAWGLYAYQNSTLNQVEPDTFANTTLSGFTDYPWLDPQSLAKLSSGPSIHSLVKVSGGSYYVITSNGKYTISTPSDWADSFSVVSQQIVDQIPGTQTLAGPYLIKTRGSGTIYLLSVGSKRPITSMAAVMMLGGSSPTILTVPDSYADSLPTGTYVLTPGSLVKTPSNGTVYMIDGLGSKITLNTFNPAIEMGISLGVATIEASVLDNYATASSPLSNILVCQGSRYTAIGGIEYLQGTTYGTPITLDPLTCGGLAKLQSHPAFLLGLNGTIYKLTGGTKQPIGAYSTYINQGGNSSNTIKASNYVLEGFQTGTTL